MRTKNTYFDNASTTWPKPPEVVAAVSHCLATLQGNPGRSGGSHTANLVSQTRELAAQLLGVSDINRLIFTPNATTGINIIFQGLLNSGDHVITSAVEHHAVFRPLLALEKAGRISLTIVPTSPSGLVNPDDLDCALAQKPTRLVTITHASNVIGSCNDIRSLGAVSHAHGALFMSDISQTAGTVPINATNDNLDLFACPGHKALFGPSGTGLCYVGEQVGSLRPFLYGGTGNYSELEDMPDAYPERLEVGTSNFHGLAGLQAGIQTILQRGVIEIQKHEMTLSQQFIDGILALPQLTLHGVLDTPRRLPVFSLTHRHHSPEFLAAELQRQFAITTRAGLQCAPRAHQTLRTFPTGTLRISPSLFHTPSDIDFILEALRQVSR